MNNFPLVCVDNFYDNPDEVRNFALKQPYYDDIGDRFPGKRTKMIKDINPDFYDKFTRKIISMFYDLDMVKVNFTLDSQFHLVPPNPSLVRYEHIRIHKDRGSLVAGLVYLSPDIEIESGTSIYQETEDGKKLETLKVGNLYNRLIMYDAMVLHGANFSSSKKVSRLTQVFFMHTIDCESGMPLVRMRDIQ